MSNDNKFFFEKLVEQESSSIWKPFPESYIDTGIRNPTEIPQISMKNESVHVVCKITDDFALMQQFSFDEDSLPPKVLCWNDLSALDIKMATKTVKAGLENEYKYIIPDLSITFQSVSLGNSDPLPIPFERNPDLLIYHILDPALTQKSRITPVPVQSQKIKISKSITQLKEIGDRTPPIAVQRVQQAPIHEDYSNIIRICNEIDTSAIFILDCSFSIPILRTIQEKSRSNPFIIFAATNDSLLYIPQLPCDLFTSCLLTPAKVALLWQSQSYSDIKSGLLSEIDIQLLIDLLNDSSIANDILSMLEKALESYVDKMAFDALKDNLPLFNSVFRQSSLISRLFSNFMFAVRIMKSVSTSPASSPQLPDLSNDPLWDSFSLQVDRALYSIKESMKPYPRKLFSYNDLLEEHLNRLESWLLFPKKDRQPPDELPYLPLLLNSSTFFEKTISFCSKFVGISRNTTTSFLYTKSFPILTSILSNQNSILEKSPLTIASFSFVIVNCLLLSPSLMTFFENNIEFWLETIKSDSEELQTASLCCLLLFSNSIGKIELYKEKKLNELLLNFVNHKSSNIRTLSHLILSSMSIGFDLPNFKINEEHSPQCRAAIINRISSTMENEILDERLKLELFFCLILSLNDPYPLVREESIIAISKAIEKEDNSFLNSLYQYIREWKDEKANNPIVTLLGHELQILQYEPSPKVNKKLNSFFEFLDLIFRGESLTKLHSNLSYGSLSRISKSIFLDLPPPNFTANTLTIKSTLIGQPTISPSGLFACGDINGLLYCQTTTNSSPNFIKPFDFFNSQQNIIDTPEIFQSLINERFKSKQTIQYLTFIDDLRILSVSNRSQVTVINFNYPDDPESAFWMSPPDTCSNILTDYNHKTFQIINSTGSSIAHIFDLERQQNIEDIRLPRIKTTSLQWLKPYSTLFYIAQDNITFFDSRTKNNISSIKNFGNDLISGNSSLSMPLYFSFGNKKGEIFMYDLRMMKEVSYHNIGYPLKQFDVHKQLPFAVALSNSFYSISFENGSMILEDQDLNYNPNSFALHNSELSCAVRIDNRIDCIIVDY